MYLFFLGALGLPLPPEKVKTSIGSANKTYTLIDNGEVNVIKKAPLQTISFEFLLPAHSYPFLGINGGVFPPSVYLMMLENMKNDKDPCRFIVTRTTAGGKVLHLTNMKVTLESYDVIESAENGCDLLISVELKEYREPESLLSKLLKFGTMVVGTLQTCRETSGSPEPKDGSKKHIVEEGDTLWAIAKKYYNDGSKYTKIAEDNNIEDPDKIDVGQELTIKRLDE